MNSILNYKGPIEHTVEVGLFYIEHKKRTEIDVIGDQKWSVIILEMPWLAYYNPEIDLKTREVRIMRCPDKYEKQQKQQKTKQIKPE